MRFVKIAIRRELIPAGVVTAVLALAALAPVPAVTASVTSGYGYANNCGVKGYGFHDHGKPCPNRPFPGKGKGVLEKLGGATAPSAADEDTKDSDQPDTDVSETTDETSPPVNRENSIASGKSHGRGHGHGGGD